MANLEDCVTAFKSRADNFGQAYHHYMNSRAESLEILGHFNDDLATLSNIPVLSALLDDKATQMSLLDWIHYSDDEHVNLNTG